MLVSALSLALAVPLGLTPIAQAQPQDKGGLGRSELPTQRVSKVEEADEPGAKKARENVAKEKNANAGQAQKALAEQRVTWPEPGNAVIELNGKKDTRATPGGLPVSVTAAGGKRGADAGTTARITVLDQKAAKRAGVTGVLLTAVADNTGEAELSVDYSGFASAVGGGWAARLGLVQLPACVLTTPEEDGCRTPTALKSDNRAIEQTVTASVRLTGTSSAISPQLTDTASTGMAVFAVMATASGVGASPSGSGNYSATELSASSSWQAGGSSGSFTWSYDFALPPAAAGPTPNLGLSYDSGSIDGRTATTNNQATSVGEGFTLSDSYIERSYGSCDDDGQDDVFDRCWKYDNARLVLDGKADRLVKESASGNTWRLENDDASRVIRSTGADNGDDDGENWTVITGDGTTYVFGLNKLDGATDQRTNSTWTVPVYGDDPGEPGYSKGTAFADRSLTQAWRWNLDYVEDTHGNAATYWYTKESNYYKKNKSTTANASYTRGGYLKEIKYGLRKGALFTDDADAKVAFNYAERCTAADCSSLTKDTSENWPDVPFDAICSSGDDDCNATGPSFFTRKRLSGISTSSWAAASSTYEPVDSWALSQEYLDGGDIGDTSDQVLTLTSLRRTGSVDSDIALNPISFTYQMRPNRVDATDDILPLTRPRLSTLTSETGAITTVTLSSPECVRGEVTGKPEDTNTRSCYPQYWNINGAENASVDWFHKYRVLAVVVSDPAGKNDTVEHSYSYAGAAWHYADDPFTPKDERTWSQWRGYRQVTVRSGAADRTQTKTISLYMQGMDGDRNKDGTTRQVTVAPLSAPDLAIAGLNDSDQFAGQLREQVTYNGATPITVTVNDPWSKDTARQSAPDADDHVARFVRTRKTTTHTYLTATSTWRTRALTTTFDDYGMADTVDDSGQLGLTTDQTCTRTWYARNTTAGITTLPSRVRVVGRSCSVTDTSLSLPTTSATRGDVLSDTATVYDAPQATTWTPAQTPTRAEATWTGRATGYPASANTDGQRLPSGWQTLSTTSYNVLGRTLTVTNADGKTTTSTYTPTTAGPLSKLITTDSKGFNTTQFIDPRRGQPLRIYDANLKKTEQTYDALGRLTAVWQPNRSRDAGYSANTTFKYHLSATSPSWVSTSALKKDGDTYNTSYALYDSLLRPLQTQSPTPQGGRLLTDTRYDTRGLAYETYADIFDTTDIPNGTYTRAEYGEAPVQTVTGFDGAERATSSSLYVYGVKKWSTSTSYTGDSSATTAVKGGTAQRTIADIRGRTVETREYAGTSPDDTAYGSGLGVSYSSVKFTYGLDDQQTSVTGPDGAKWTYGYDLFGRQVSAGDPDKGTVTTTYNVLDQAVKATDARGKSVVTAYDELGRATGTWSGSQTNANQLTARTYDTVLKGLPSTSTRYVGGKNGQAYTKAITAYDSLSRPVATQLRLPATDPFVAAGTPTALEYTSHYNIDGTLQNTEEPALGGLPSEIIDYGYNGLGHVTSVGAYLLDTDYSALGQPRQLTLGTGNTADFKKSYITNTYEEGTGRLTRSHVTDQTHPYMLQDLNYTFDDAGNVTAIADPATLGGTSRAETQCFTYDGHRRLTEAWTPTSQNCADAPSTGSLSGPAPYRTSYTYTTAGQRGTETQHKTTGNTKTTYCYTGTQPHTLMATSTKADCVNPDQTYTYDQTGNTIRRPGKTSTQVLDWSTEGQLTGVTEADTTTNYLYDADGTLLIRTTENGERVLYAGATELHLKANNTTWAQRYYASGDLTVAVRTNETGTSKLSFLAGDHHGTSSLAISADTSQAVTKRYTTPFGAPRGTSPTTWPDDKGFLGKPADTTTGLTHIGAREYDPAIGQFLSVDPLLMPGQHQSLNGYSYANQHPATTSDPTGMCEDPGNGRCHQSSTSGSGREGKPDPSFPLDPGVTYSGGSNSGGGSSGGSGSSGGGGTGSTSSTEPTPPPNPGPPPVPEAYSGDHAGGSAWALLGVVAELALPDVEAWKNCAAAPGLTLDCASALGDIPTPLTKSFKLLKLRKADDAIDAVKKKTPTGCKCFLAGTDVLMADGTTKDIERVKLGDKVQATDPETGEAGSREVTRLIVTEDDKHFNTLSVATNGGVEKLTATHEHPFWSPSENRWVEAGELQPAMTLLTDDGATVIVTANRPFTKHARTYNLTVDDLHTYYVLAGKTPVLVHNSNCFGDKWSDTNNLDEHFRKHGEEMGFDTMTEYNYAAQDLMCMCDGRRPGVRMKRDGDVQRFFDPESGEFGSAGPRGIITYFKPDDDLDYFRRQPGVEVP